MRCSQNRWREKREHENEFCHLRADAKKPQDFRLKAFDFPCDPNRIRTYDLQIRNLLLYPAELWDHLRFYRGTKMQNFLKSS